MSPLGVSKYQPFSKKAMWLTGLEWPLSVLQQDPVATSYSYIVLLLDTDATSQPSGEKTTQLTGLEWPSSMLRQDPVTAFYSCIVSSQDADATSQLSSKKAMWLTEPDKVATIESAAMIIGDGFIQDFKYITQSDSY